MARPLDPFRTLELPRDATLEDVKAAYRRLAKAYHPDSAGDRALPRFLAVQAAYEALTEGPGRLRPAIGTRTRPAAHRATTSGSTSARPGRAAAGTGAASGPRAASGATAGATAGDAPRGGPTRSGAGAPSAAGARATAGGDASTGGRPGSSRTKGAAGPRPRRTKRAPGSTSYDGAESEPFEPEWEGASWYGGSSGTYWTINPREFADPRKHGPEYLARGRAETRRGSRPRGTPPPAPDAAPPSGPIPGSGSQPAAAAPYAAATEAAAVAQAEGPARAADPAASTGPTFTARGRRVWDVGWEDPAVHGRSALGSARTGRYADPDAPRWTNGRAGRTRGSDVTPLGLVAVALAAMAVVSVLFALLTQPSTPGAASVVPIVAFCGVAIIALVSVLRRDGPPRT